MTRDALHEVLSGRRLTRLEYEHELPQLQDRLLDAQFELRKARRRSAILIVTGIPGAGRSEVVNELLELARSQVRDGLRFPRAEPDGARAAAPVALLAGDAARGSHRHHARRLVRRTCCVKPCCSGTAQRPLSAPLRREIERIQRLERMLVCDGVAVVKVHLHIAPDTQRKRLAKLQRDKTTRWRVTKEDRWMARHYHSVERALGRCLEATGQPAAPWHLVDGTDSQHRALEVGRTLLAGLAGTLCSRDVALSSAAGGTTRRRSAATRNVRLPTTHRGTRVSDDEYDAELERLRGRLALLSRRRRFNRHSVVAAFEGMDASGKGGVIRRIASALDARQYRVVPISAPTPEELARPYLWRFWFQLPPRGNYTIFDRSWYGRVLVERVRGLASRADWQRAYDEINEFERQFAEHRVVVAKFWLSVSRDEQLERFKERDRNPLKRFKVDPEDWTNRGHWTQYQAAVREMIARTNTAHAPWTIVPADDKRHARLAVLRRLADQVESALG